MSATIAINTIIEWLDDTEEANRLERVLWIDPKGKDVVVFTLFNPKALPEWKDAAEIEKALAEGVAIKRINDPYTTLALPDSEILQKHCERRDRAWEIIKDLVVDEPDIYKSEGRGRLLHQTSGQFSVQTKTVYKYLRKYWAGGKTKNALLPAYDQCGAPGKKRKTTEGKKRGRPSKISKLDNEKMGINVDNDIRRIFRVAIQLYYNNKDKAPLKRAYDLMIQKHFNKGYREEGNIKIPILPVASELPTFGQFRYWYTKELDLRQSITAREGKRGFALRHRAVLGKSTQMAIGPGSIYQIDATIADVYLVSSFDRSLIIGRPVIYVVIDVFSRMITGLHVGLEGPSWIGAMMALANATIDKVAFCAEVGIEISGQDWPCHYLPETILADRGELEGVNADNLVDSLNIAVANTPPYRADWKGIVEQSFRLANLKAIHWLPGAIKERFRERGERDHRLDATLDLQQFTKIVVLTAINHNLHHRIEWYLRDEFMIQEHVEPIPIDLWKWGIKNRSGHLREMSPEIIMLNLMPKGDATVTFKGIRFKGMYYSCERAIHEQWFERSRAYGSWTVPVSYDPRKTDIIYLRMKGGKEVETCQLLKSEERYKGRRLEEVLDLLEFEHIQSSLYANEYLQSKAELSAHIEAIVHLAAALGLGVLVIDEIQRLNEAKSGGAAKMLNFFVQLVNTIGVPVVLVGTFKALHLMTREFAQARRSAGQGDLIWANLARDDVWVFFIDGLWEYQWTNISSPLTPALRQVLYEESQGIVDIAVKLYMFAQWHVIGQEDERIYPGLIRDVAKESLKLAKPILDALKVRDIQKLSQISDVYPPIRSLDEHFQRATDRITIEGTLNTLRNQQKAEKNIVDDDMESPIIRVAQWLVEAGIEPKTARECTVKALNRHGSEFDLRSVMQEAFTFAVKFAASQGVESSIKEEFTQEPNHRKRKEKIVFSSGDLREVVGKGKKKGIPAHQLLKDAGVIKPVGEFLTM